MKKAISGILSVCLLAAALAGCGGAREKAAGLTVVAAVFPAWDWTRALLGENPAGIELTLLLDKSVDMHSYQPTVEDIVKISACDLFIYVGGESDAWVTEALEGAVNREMKTVNLMEILGDAAKLEESVEGMQSRGADGEEYDEHVWLSPRNARLFCGAIRDGLTAIDPENGALYAENAAFYGERLEALDGAYRQAAGNGTRNVLLFADRFPFRYLLDDYGLRYYAAFAGCEAETEASFETVLFLAGKVDELGLPCVLATESPAPRLAETVVENTRAKNAKILALDSMQSVTAERIEAGATYLGIMEQNLETMKEALK